MNTLQPVESMTDDEKLTAFGTSEDPRQRGFDEATHSRVLAYELVRARNRLAYYRTLYASYIDAGKPFMVENLDDGSSDGSVPAKLIFTTEPMLIDALAQERAVHDFFTELLDELEPALR